MSPMEARAVRISVAPGSKSIARFGPAPPGQPQPPAAPFAADDGLPDLVDRRLEHDVQGERPERGRGYGRADRHPVMIPGSEGLGRRGVPDPTGLLSGEGTPSSRGCRGPGRGCRQRLSRDDGDDRDADPLGQPLLLMFAQRLGLVKVGEQPGPAGAPGPLSYRRPLRCCLSWSARSSTSSQIEGLPVACAPAGCRARSSRRCR